MGIGVDAMFSERDLFWMRRSIELARRASQQNEVPVGAQLVLNDQVIGEGWNCSISRNDPTAHAEIVALRTGAEKVSNYRLVNTTLYVTLEPCTMCAGAIVHARIKRLVFGAYDSKAGAIISAAHLLDQSFLNHQIEHTGGLLADECGCLLSNFFLAKRKP